MTTRATARGLGARAAAFAACLAMTGTAYAAADAEPSGGHAAGVTMAGAGERAKLRYGQRMRIRGRAGAGVPGRTVWLERAPRGRRWRPVARASTAERGSYRFTVRPRRSAAYRVTAEGGSSSRSRRVIVVARIAARATRHVRRGRRMRVRGLLLPGLGGRLVRVQLRTRRGWRTVDRARTRGSGRFGATWLARRPGAYRLRLRFGGDRLNAGVRRSLRRVYVYRPARASWYGPGFYGRRTACGRILRRGTLGVAHRRLPCGARVRLRYGGRSLAVPVIDRGPYAAGREWDLTAATRRRLRFPSTGTVWSTR